MTTPTEKSHRVLVIEDDADFGPLLTRRLVELPANVELVECVDDAVEKLDQNAYDLVVVDIWLPKTRSDLSEKRKLEEKYDELTEQLMQSKDEAQRRALREDMELTIAEARRKLVRRGGLTILERMAGRKKSIGEILFLTAIGNDDMQQDAAVAAESLKCQLHYLVKPQAPEAIQAKAEELLRRE